MFVSHGLCGHCNIPLDAVGKICQRSDSLLRRRRKVVNTSSYLCQDARGRLRHSRNTAAENIKDGYRLLKRAGKFSEAKEYRKKLIETMYSAEHLKMVMSMDFERPKEKMRQMLEESGASIHDDFI